uniref:Uncharacterized protein n=1 Tax=Davidia involucrata TaxID=16924 RepID=A0A5B7AMN1_DAVIN
MEDINSRTADIEAQGSAAIAEIETEDCAAMAELETQDTAGIAEIETEDSVAMEEIETDDSSAMEEIETEDTAACAEIETQDSALIDIENPHNVLVSHIAQKLDNMESTPSMQHCIYQVRMELRKINEEAYTPRVVSIGPFHYGSERFKSMEKHKLDYFKKLIGRGNKRLEDYVVVMKKLEDIIRQRYAETIKLDSDEFVMMILVDAGFIIELLRRYFFWDRKEQNHLEVQNEPLLYNSLQLDNICHDLLLLENQLPFFVLEVLFYQTFAPFPENFPPLLQLTLDFFKNYYKCLLDIHFSNGVLEIPCFELSDQTTPFIRNLMALELCHYPHDSYINDYIILMNNLIKAPKDVDLLVKKGILVNGLGDSSAAATFFNPLSRQIKFSSSNFYYSRLCKDLNAYKKVPWEVWMAIFKHDYCSTPWRTASTTAAVILLVLTFIQAVCSILSLKGV